MKIYAANNTRITLIKQKLQKMQEYIYRNISDRRLLNIVLKKLRG